MMIRKMALLALAVLVPGALLVVLLRSVLRSGFGDAPNFAVNNLPALFTSNGINQVQVETSSATEFEGVSGVSSLATGNHVTLRGLLFKTAGDPILIAKKIRKQ